MSPIRRHTMGSLYKTHQPQRKFPANKEICLLGFDHCMLIWFIWSLKIFLFCQRFISFSPNWSYSVSVMLVVFVFMLRRDCNYWNISKQADHQSSTCWFVGFLQRLQSFLRYFLDFYIFGNNSIGLKIGWNWHCRLI